MKGIFRSPGREILEVSCRIFPTSECPFYRAVRLYKRTRGCAIYGVISINKITVSKRTQNMNRWVGMT